MQNQIVRLTPLSYNHGLQTHDQVESQLPWYLAVLFRSFLVHIVRPSRLFLLFALDKPHNYTCVQRIDQRQLLLGQNCHSAEKRLAAYNNRPDPILTILLHQYFERVSKTPDYSLLTNNLEKPVHPKH